MDSTQERYAAQANPDQIQDAVYPGQGTRLYGNPQGDDFTMRGPIHPEAGNGPRYGINDTGAHNNHGHDDNGNGVGGTVSTPDGHHIHVPILRDPQRDDTSGAGPKMG